MGYFDKYGFVYRISNMLNNWINVFSINCLNEKE